LLKKQVADPLNLKEKMNKCTILHLISVLICFSSCQTTANEQSSEDSLGTIENQVFVSATNDSTDLPDETPEKKELINYDSLYNSYHDTAFVDVKLWEPSIYLDIRYATEDNFMKTQVYDCPKCLLRKKVAQAVIKAHKDLQALGYGGLKMYDCYRPFFVQFKLWEVAPRKGYVADPTDGVGSMHNRGQAVDLTIVDSLGKELEMGTAYDFFGKEAHPGYMGHPKEVIANRQLLAQTLAKYGFGGVKSEWWHFSYRQRSFKTSNEPFDCQ